MASSMPFIISSVGHHGEAVGDRQLIRRHVMLGKNKGKKRPRRAFRDQRNDESARASDAIRDAVRRVPPKVGTDLSFIDFADTVELSLIGDILKFSKIAKQTFFPLEPCIAFDKKSKFHQSFVPLTFDALYLNAMVFSTQSWFCATTCRALDKRISYHLVKSISLLRDRLTDATESGGKEKISDPTINAIVMLAGQALLTGEETTARKHVTGLNRLVEMRGGLATLESNTKLLMEVLRMDISLAMYTNSDPIFHEACLEQHWYQLPQVQALRNVPTTVPKIDDDELVQLWLTMHHFTTLINDAISTSHKLPEELMLETMAGVMYPLVAMTFDVSSLEHAIRLGLLAFCSQAFLPWSSVKLPFDVFPESWTRCMQIVTKSHSAPSGLALWLLVIGSIALFPSGCEKDDILSLLRRTIHDSGIKSWVEMRQTLQGYLWLDFIFDNAAEALWNRVINDRD